MKYNFPATRVVFVFAMLAMSSLLAGCAASVTAPVVVSAYPADQLASLRIKDIRAESAVGVNMNQTDLTRIVDAVRAEIESAVPGKIVNATSPEFPSALTMKLTFTDYDSGNAFMRTMLAGLGQIHIDADIALIDDSNIVKGQYKISKQFAFGGVVGGSTRIEDVEVGFAKSVAAILKGK